MPKLSQKNSDDLDQILVKLCELVIKGQATDPNLYGLVGACIIGPDGNKIGRTSYNVNGKYVHAERAALDAYEKKHGHADSTCMCVTTLSPCSNTMHDRIGSSCKDLLEERGITNIYAGYRDPTQSNRHFRVTNNKKIQLLCKQFADTFLKDTLP